MSIHAPRVRCFRHARWTDGRVNLLILYYLSAMFLLASTLWMLFFTIFYPRCFGFLLFSEFQKSLNEVTSLINIWNLQLLRVNPNIFLSIVFCLKQKNNCYLEFFSILKKNNRKVQWSHFARLVNKCDCGFSNRLTVPR